MVSLYSDWAQISYGQFLLWLSSIFGYVVIKYVVYTPVKQFWIQRFGGVGFNRIFGFGSPIVAKKEQKLRSIFYGPFPIKSIVRYIVLKYVCTTL